MDRGDGRWIGGVFLPPAQLGPVLAVEQRARENAQLRAARDTLETLPQRTFLFLTLLTLFLAVWVGLTLARTITDPVRALAKAAQRVGAGDLQVELPVTGEDELAFLSGSFNTMIADLRHSREALVEQSLRLEQGRAYLDRLLAALPVGVMSWRGNGDLVSANSAARRMLGADPSIPPAWSELRMSPSAGRLPELVELARNAGALPRRSCAWAARAKAAWPGPSSSPWARAACWRCWRISRSWPAPRNARPGRKWRGAWRTK